MHDDLSACEFTGDGERFSLSPGERDGVGASVASNLSGIFSHLSDSPFVAGIVPRRWLQVSIRCGDDSAIGGTGEGGTEAVLSWW